MSETQKQTDAAGSPARPGSAPLRYGQILAAIEDAPTTYLGGILAIAVRTCIKRPFFRNPDMLVKYVVATIKHMDESPNAPASATSEGVR